LADVKSDQVTTLDAEPTQVLQTGILTGRLRVAQFKVDLTDVGASDTAFLIDLPVNATLLELNLFQDGADSTAFDIGDSNDADGIVDGQAVNQEYSLKAGTSNTTGTNGMTSDDFQKQLWEVLGYSSRVAAGRAIRLQATFGSEPADNTVYGYVVYAVD
jgi:hypothetical protein